MRRVCRERFPHHRIQRKPQVSDPGMHHGTCVRCMSGSLIRGGGVNVPGILGACATSNFAYLARGPWGPFYSHIETKWSLLSLRHFPVHVLEWKCMNCAKISLKFVPKVRSNNITALVQIMSWRRSGDKPLSELVMVELFLLTRICVTRPQWVIRINFDMLHF